MKDTIEKCCYNFKSCTHFYDKFNYIENKDKSITAFCDNLLLFKIVELKNSYKIFSKIQIPDIKGIIFVNSEDPDIFFRYLISEKENFEKFFYDFTSSFMNNVDSYILNNYKAEPFGCCSRYVACSDNKKCIHPDVLHSKGCEYRKNLEAGKIFYGKNKNI